MRTIYTIWVALTVLALYACTYHADTMFSFLVNGDIVLRANLLGLFAIFVVLYLAYTIVRDWWRKRWMLDMYVERNWSKYVRDKSANND